jgi:hypothetical protein
MLKKRPYQRRNPDLPRKLFTKMHMDYTAREKVCKKVWCVWGLNMEIQEKASGSDPLASRYSRVGKSVAENAACGKQCTAKNHTE